ncbi:MAG: M20/M25/M40 family metallo-hydrolase [Bacteroidetes bacterium]|nr:M20/M25/M40 family metallo-hydrolase [Bacteroidota bacterium]
MNKTVSFFLTYLFLSVAGFAQSSLIHHEINARVNPSDSFLEVTDEITIPENLDSNKLNFKLHNALTVSSLTEGINIELVNKDVKAKDVGMDREESDSSNNLLLNEYRIVFPTRYTGDLYLQLRYSGKIESPIEQSAENYARGFNESPGIISDIGVYLAGSTYWVPYFSDELITFNLTATTPAGWKTVSQGKRTKDEDVVDHHVDQWESPEPMEEVFFIAAKFTEYDYTVGAVTAMAFLRTPDEGLANKYLQTTAQYLEMYRQLVGLYPYSKFALVENFWETGYGMPSFTLLGESVIRLPFILHSSYPHELLHNWWGNSVYVDIETGNWCEGLTTYMADHLIKEQRGQGIDYRRSTLQKFTNYVNEDNDFPLSDFRSRYNEPSEAIGYGKCLMMWNMLRQDLGDETFVRGFQNFNRTNKFKIASFDDIRISMEEKSGEDLVEFFTQWITRTGAPELQMKNVSVNKSDEGYTIEFTIAQVQKEDPFFLNVPVFIYTESDFVKEIVEMNSREKSYVVTVSNKPVKIDIDPEFDLFRRLHYNEIPPALSTAYGSDKVLVILPSGEDETAFESYETLANKWLEEKPDKFEIIYDNEIKTIPTDKAVWVFGWNNEYKILIQYGVSDYNIQLNDNSVDIDKKTLGRENNSFIVSVRNPNNPEEVVVWLTIGNKDAVPGLVRKLPHYGKYSYLVFEGDEPANIEKGQWQVVNSPLSKILVTGKEIVLPKIPNREPLAKLQPVFSGGKMLEHVKYLASDDLKGRGLGTEELEKAAQYIADQFKAAGLQPAGDDGTFFQVWEQKVGKDRKQFSFKNVIGIIPGTDEKLAGQSVVLSAHYDHLGLGWPDVRKGNEGKIHYGADDNASGVAVMIELAKLMGKTEKPKRTIVFVAFTGEEAGLIGSRNYVKNYTTFPADKVMANLNLDTVGRLFGKKLLVLNGSSAKEWKFIFMGTDYVTGIPTSMVQQQLDASDQTAFIEAGVPAVQLFSGSEEDYHKPTDTYDKIDGDGMVKVAAVTKEVIQYLAEREEPLAFTGETGGEKSQRDQKDKTQKKERRVSTGTMPDFEFTGEGVKIGAVMPDSPAEKSGLLKGDVIVKFDDKPVKNLRDYSNLLKEHQPGDVVTIEYVRDGQHKTVQLELGER